MEENKVVMDRETFKALAVESRLNILKLLMEKPMTQSEIAETLNLRNSTVNEHLGILKHAKLIKQEETNRKWKYCYLTFKGKNVVNPNQVKVLVSFLLTTTAFIVTTFMSAKNFLSQKILAAQAPQKEIAGEGGIAAAEEVQTQSAETAIMQAETAKAASEQIANMPYGWVIASIILLIIAVALLTMYFKKPKVVVVKK